MQDAPDTPDEPPIDELPIDRASEPPPCSPRRAVPIIPLTIVFEAGLGVFALLVGWVLGLSPAASLQASSSVGFLQAIGIGLLATLPMLLGLVLIDRYPIGPLRGLSDLVDDRLTPLFARARIWQLFVLSAAAGFGEELLFRGLLQSGLAHWIGGERGSIVGVVVASLIFGACHWLSHTYAVLATLMGFYFAAIFLVADNLLAPILTHALYDFVALVYLVRWKTND